MSAKLLVVGECIAKRELGGPFTNRAGRFFREMMTNAGVKPERAAFAYPKDLTDLVIAIGQHESKYVVLSGDLMLSFVHPELRIGECHGRAMLHDPTTDDDTCPIVFPVFNHEAVARAPKQHQTTVQEELKLLRRIGVDRANWAHHIPTTCVRCRGEMVASTPTGVVYCNKHFTPTAA